MLLHICVCEPDGCKAQAALGSPGGVKHDAHGSLDALLVVDEGLNQLQVLVAPQLCGLVPANSDRCSGMHAL